MGGRMREHSRRDFIAPSKPTPLEPLIASSVWGIMFSYVLGNGWLQAGWLGRLAGIPVLTSKKQVLHVFFIVLQKNFKNQVFSYVFGSLKMQDFTI